MKTSSKMNLYLPIPCASREPATVPPVTGPGPSRLKYQPSIDLGSSHFSRFIALGAWCVGWATDRVAVARNEGRLASQRPAHSQPVFSVGPRALAGVVVTAQQLQVRRPIRSTARDRGHVVHLRPWRITVGA